MSTQEIFIPEGESKTLQVCDDNMLVRVSKNASLVLTEMRKAIMSRTIRLTVRLEGEGASVIDKSRYQGFKNAVLDIERVIVHAAPATTSHIDTRGILHDASRVVWRGCIQVERDAKKAQAFLRHDAILAGEEAYVDAAPFLEIYTDDAICKHSASVRRIQPASLFYIKSRGVSEEDARNMLLEGFLA